MITSEIVCQSLQQYPEISMKMLEFQLPMFKGTTGASSLHEASQAYVKMDRACRQMFSEVYMLIKLLLVCPISSCECERSFSTLHSLKTWLRSTLMQQRLNHITVSHVHRDELDTIHLDQLTEEFIERFSQRKL